MEVLRWGRGRRGVRSMLDCLRGIPWGSSVGFFSFSFSPFFFFFDRGLRHRVDGGRRRC